MANYNYSSAAEVVAYTRHYLDGQTSFNSTTRPTGTEVRAFLERASNVLNLALAAQGLSVPVTQAQAKFACDDWVTTRAAQMVELTQRGTGYSEADGSRIAGLRSLQDDANKFAAQNRLGFIRLGVTVGHTMSEGLEFTGLDVQSNRADPDDTSLEQPSFWRGQFDDSSGTGAYGLGDDDE